MCVCPVGLLAISDVRPAVLNFSWCLRRTRRRPHDTMCMCVGVTGRVPRTRHCTQNQHHHLPKTNIPAIRISVSHRLNVSSVHNDGFGNWPPRNDRASSARYLRDHILCCPCSYSSRLSRSLEQFNSFYIIPRWYWYDTGLIPVLYSGAHLGKWRRVRPVWLLVSVLVSCAAQLVWKFSWLWRRFCLCLY